MIINLRAILHGHQRFDFILEPDWWEGNEENGQIMGLAAPLKVHMNISRLGERHLLEGSLSGVVLVWCARCLESYHRDLATEFRLFLTSLPANTDQNELELSEDDMWVDFVAGDEVNLLEIVREQIYLSLPMKTLCREDCFGLCPRCGTNLNKKKCSCERENGDQSFSKLKNLKVNGS
ncbi:MAG: DUF177 domain-containing protein [Thermodesulfobacteriota bacterium]|nr:DUF177 domain-containing protein [Thermodesulfobacteriota bacterium]